MAASKNQFFDRPAIIEALGAKRAKALSRIGAYVRKVAMQSMRRQKKPTPKGKPPAFHDSATISLRSIQFGWGIKQESLLIGSIKSQSSKSPIPIPRLHEKGGTGPVHERRLIPQGQETIKLLKRRKKLASQFNTWVHGGSKVIPLPKELQYRVDHRVRMARFPKRPYMRPAMLKARRKMPQMFKGIMKQTRPPKKR